MPPQPASCLRSNRQASPEFPPYFRVERQPIPHPTSTRVALVWYAVGLHPVSVVSEVPYGHNPRFWPLQPAICPLDSAAAVALAASPVIWPTLRPALSATRLGLHLPPSFFVLRL